MKNKADQIKQQPLEETLSKFGKIRELSKQNRLIYTEIAEYF